MAIVTMKKLTLISVLSDKESIFDSLVKSACVELKRSADIDACTSLNVSAQRERIAEKIARTEEAIAYVKQQTELYNAKNKRNKSVAEVKLPHSSFARPLTEINYDYFLHFGSNSARIDSDMDALTSLKQQIAEITAQKTQKESELKRLSLIVNLPHPTSWYADTESSFVQLVQFNDSERESVIKLTAEYDMAELEIIDTVQSKTVAVAVVHKSQAEFFERALTFGVVKCPVACDVLPKVALEDLSRQIAGLNEQLGVTEARVVSYADNLSEWKIYVDYLALRDKKLSAEGDLQITDKTFVMEASYPAEDENKVTKAIEDATNYAVTACNDIGEDEFAPTLVKNNKVVRPFESITNMYSPPAYHEIDPNPVMSVFYFLIFGFMVADIGYGALLLAAGLFATFAIKQRTGVKTMLQLFGICGLSAIVVGALFGSVFCFPIYDNLGIQPPIPAPDKYPMVMMILSLILGIVHICAGIGCKMAVKIKSKQYLAAWLADFPWIIMFISLIVAIFNTALDMAAYEPWAGVRLPDIVGRVALYVCLASLAVGVIFAGLGSKGFLGKVKSSFGSVYGIINYFSDVMSYIRVFGLMLSSALVGSVINDISKMLIGDGSMPTGYIFAGIVLIIAHLFNLAMGVLSVYIHNGRLQYVEFFGKFYTGEGQLFIPFCSDTKYVIVKDK